MRNRDQIIEHLSYYQKAAPSEAGLRCAQLLEAWQGLHHLDESLKKADFSNPRYVEITVRTGLATHDFSELTSLVLLCHALLIRAEIVQGKGGRGNVTMMLHPRQASGGMAQRHPSLSDLRQRIDEMMATELCASVSSVSSVRTDGPA